jgi:glycosyltransferase involved in cell wall biosynthesis
MSKADIAVIMSVYKFDSLIYLKKALESLYAQEGVGLDIFLQLDGPVCPDVYFFLKKEVNSGRVEYLGERNINKGLASSLNDLLEVVLARSYRYVARMDADDISAPGRFFYQYSFMERCLEVDVCGGQIEEFNMDNLKRQVVHYPIRHDEILRGMGYRNSMAHVTCFFRSSFFSKAGLYNTLRKNEDYDLWLRGFLNECIFANLEEILVFVRTNNDFFSRRKNYRRALEVCSIKINFTKKFRLGLGGYFYAFAHFVLFMSPSFVKRFSYRHLRG